MLIFPTGVLIEFFSAMIRWIFGGCAFYRTKKWKYLYDNWDGTGKKYNKKT